MRGKGLVVYMIGTVKTCKTLIIKHSPILKLLLLLNVQWNGRKKGYLTVDEEISQ